MTARTIAIGDIHGCATALETLLAAIDPQPDDSIITVGDYIDRGPDSRGVLDQLIALTERCRLTPLLGNHEIMMMMAFDDMAQLTPWLRYGGMQTLDSYGGSPRDIPESHLEFIRGCRRYHETAGHFYVHASYKSDLPLDRQPDMLLFWQHLSGSGPKPHVSGKTAIVGHTPQTDGEILRLEHLICIDTWCFGDGWLTALDVNSGEVWQANQRGEQRSR